MTPLSESDFSEAARALGVEVAAIRAVDHVESRGNGFLPTGEPKILFERHIFSRLTKGRYDKSHPDLSSPRPGGYGKSEDQHVRLARATSLDRDAALKSASWGRYQIMGFNYEYAGYEKLQDFINAMYRSEQDHLKAFCSFLRRTRLDRFLRMKDFAGFARGYNGPAYQQNRYDEKLLTAYRHFTAKNTGGA